MKKERILKLEHLHYSFYLRGWKLFVWRYFMKKVYPDWEKGHKEHWKLMDEGHFVHNEKNNSCSCESF